MEQRPAPSLQLLSPTASPEEAAAVVAALERFIRDTAAPVAAHEEAPEAWRRAAFLEATAGFGEAPDADPWINA